MVDANCQDHMKKDIIARALKEFKKYFTRKEEIEYPYLDSYNASVITEHGVRKVGKMVPVHKCVETTTTTWYEELAEGEKKGEDGNVIPFPPPKEPPIETPKEPEDAA